MPTQYLDPLRAASRIEEDYRGYLRSAFSPSDPTMRAAFDGQLSAGLELTRGPILQAVPPYATGASVAELIAEGVLSHHFERLAETGFGLQRPLYHHQEQAIRRLGAGRNAIVATGTGSGKTEAFLLPILEHLAQEIDSGTVSSPGVRALLLYPMNALANDQLGRLRDLLLPFPEITFGRYVGDTPHKRAEGVQQHRMRFKSDPPPNELVCRDDMKERPPHLLVTNFAMLEYLLVRPEDQRFFDGSTSEHWKFIVLDEVHVYDGAKGAEIGMLLRRVRERILTSERGRLRCVGTSATLGQGPDDRPLLMEFAEQIFDEPFTWTDQDRDACDLVEAKRDELVLGDATWSCDPSTFLALRDTFRAGGDASALHEAAGAATSAPQANESPEAWLGRALGTEDHLVRLQLHLGDGSVDIGQAAADVFGDAKHAPALAALVDLAVSADASGSDRSLLPARWHFLLRALEGAFYCLAPHHPEEQSRLLLSRHLECPACAGAGLRSAMFETAVCRRCGAQYLVGLIDDDSKLVSAGLNIDEPRHFLVGDALELAEDDDELALDDDAEPSKFDPYVLCTGCGAIDRRSTGCGCGIPARQLLEVCARAAGKPIRQCAGCGGRTSGGSLLQRFTTGADAPVAVVATSLYQELPPAPTERRSVGDGRKLLSFADSRLDAAFFAPYLERTYNRAVQRRLLWTVMAEKVAEGDTALRMADLRSRLKNLAVEVGVVDEYDRETTPDQHARHWLVAEMLSTDRQQNLEGVGLAELAVPIPRGLTAPQELLALGLQSDEVFDLVRVLLDTIRRGRAITIDSDVDLDDPIFEGRPTTGIREFQSQSRVLSWNPTRGSNQRVGYLQKVLERLGRSDDAASLLGAIWGEWLADPRGDWSGVLVMEESRGIGVLHRLDSARLEFLPVTDDHQPLQCDHCRQVWWRSVRGACPGVSCPGTVGRVEGELPRSHYRRLYTSLSPIGQRVEEHTAQLTAAVAAKRQQEFIDGDINVLSCSTTFELGVDVGEIQSVLMRNMPPSAANYVQRAGRAGRRAGSPALVVTFAQRRSHDLHFFDHPHSMVDGHVSAPVVRTDNPAIVRRHLFATAFAMFQKLQADGAVRVNHTVADFFFPKDDSPADRMMRWVRSAPEDLLGSIRRITPETLHEHPDLDLANLTWADGLDGDFNEPGMGRLRLAQQEIQQEIAALDAQLSDAYTERKKGRIYALEPVLKTLRRDLTLNRLARAGILPKYGFPVDVVTLDLGADAAVELDRDLAMAIVEFAPGNEIVADKRVWTSTGIKIPAGLNLLFQRWGKCTVCGAQRTWLEELESVPPCRVCGSESVQGSGRFVQPRFGFLGADTGRRPGDRRPARNASRSFFFDTYEGTEPARELTPIGSQTVGTRVSRQGRITVMNSGPGGRGYETCTWCGHLAKPGETPPEGHPRPRDGKPCTGSLRHTALGHWFVTDTIEIDLPWSPDEDHALALLHSLLAAPSAVGVKDDDVNGTLRPSASGGWALVLFDTVPGGAGHCRRIATRLPDLFRGAFQRVSTCDCGEETSCYGCLRSYRNQFDHHRLRRGFAVDQLKVLGL